MQEGDKIASQYASRLFTTCLGGRVLNFRPLGQIVDIQGQIMNWIGQMWKMA